MYTVQMVSAGQHGLRTSLELLAVSWSENIQFICRYCGTKIYVGRYKCDSVDCYVFEHLLLLISFIFRILKTMCEESGPGPVQLIDDQSRVWSSQITGSILIWWNLGYFVNVFFFIFRCFWTGRLPGWTEEVICRWLWHDTLLFQKWLI